MSFETILTVIFAILTILGAGLSYYLYIKNKILGAANDAINVAEDSDKFESDKMKIAVAEIMNILPTGARVFFTEERVTNIVQVAFDSIELFAHKQADKNK